MPHRRVYTGEVRSPPLGEGGELTTVAWQCLSEPEEQIKTTGGTQAHSLPGTAAGTPQKSESVSEIEDLGLGLGCGRGALLGERPRWCSL